MSRTLRLADRAACIYAPAVQLLAAVAMSASSLVVTLNALRLTMPSKTRRSSLI